MSYESKVNTMRVRASSTKPSGLIVKYRSVCSLGFTPGAIRQKNKVLAPWRCLWEEVPQHLYQRGFLFPCKSALELVKIHYVIPQIHDHRSVTLKRNTGNPGRIPIALRQQNEVGANMLVIIMTISSNSLYN